METNQTKTQPNTKQTFEEYLFKNQTKFKDFLDDLYYYFIDKPKDIYYNLKWYFSNRFLFNKVLWDWRPWDSAYQVDLFKFGIEQLCKCIENGHEEDISRNKKVEAMKKLITELSRDVEEEVHNNVYGKDYDYQFYVDENGVLKSDRDEKESQKLHKKFVEQYYKERKNHYKTIFHLIEGQDQKELEKLQNEQIEKLSEKQKEKQQGEGYYSIWVKNFDGSGIASWWD